MMTKSTKKTNCQASAAQLPDVVQSGAELAKETMAPPAAPERKTKASSLRDMVMQPGGASLQSLMAATGWQAHTVRAALSGLRKAGTHVSRTSGESGPVYAIAIASTETSVGTAIGAEVKARARKKLPQAAAAAPEARAKPDTTRPSHSAADAANSAPDIATDATSTAAVLS